MSTLLWRLVSIIILNIDAPLAAADVKNPARKDAFGSEALLTSYRAANAANGLGVPAASAPSRDLLGYFVSGGARPK